VDEPSSNSARLAAWPIDEGGTPVEVWTQWPRNFPVFDVNDCRTLVLVAAHPDDETLGLGATAAMLSRRGVTVQVVAVTDGEAAYPDGSCGRRELAKLRRDELAAAAEALGLPTPIFLRIPDGEVQPHERRLSARLGMMLAGFDRGTWCAATWRPVGPPRQPQSALVRGCSNTRYGCGTGRLRTTRRCRGTGPGASS
jgi:hypothetical protein